jgi:histone deacetylase 1/2
VPGEIPYNDFFEYYAPDFKLHLTPSATMENMNKPEQLQAICSRVLQNLKNLDGAPSVQMHPVPPDWAIQSTQNVQQMEGNNNQTLLLTLHSLY